MKSSRLAAIACSSLMLAMSMVATAEAQDASQVKVPEAGDLQQEGSVASQHQMPILLFFSSGGCPYCVRVEDEFLKPMIFSGEYDNRVIIRKAYMDSASSFKGFDGRSETGQSLGSKYDVFVTPTLVFVGPKGDELAERLIGINTEDYYGAYIDRSINIAQQKLQQKTVAQFDSSER